METLEINTQQRLNRLRQKQAARRKKKFKRRVSAIAALAIALTGSFATVYAVSAKEIIITEIDEFANTVKSITVKTRAENVKNVLLEQGISLSETDKLNLPADSSLSDDTEIILKHGKEIKIITPEGEDTVIITSADPADAVRECGYTLSSADEINFDGESVATSAKIEVRSISYSYETVEEEIPFETEYTESDSLYKGQSETKQEGQNGVVTKTYSVARYNDGTEKSRELSSEEITVQPVNKLIINGTKNMPAAQTAVSAASDTSGHTIAGHTYSKKITMNATAYTNQPGANKTATGTTPHPGTVAVDPKVIPLGTKLYVVSNDGKYVYGEAVAEDTGGAIKGNKIDLFYPTRNECMQFGRRDVTVYVLN